MFWEWGGGGVKKKEKYKLFSPHIPVYYTARLEQLELVLRYLILYYYYTFIFKMVG